MYIIVKNGRLIAKFADGDRKLARKYYRDKVQGLRIGENIRALQIPKIGGKPVLLSASKKRF